MKTLNKYIILLIVILSITSTINSSQSKSNTSKISIICTNSILADFTKNILKDNATIDYIMPPGACPTHFDTSPNDMSKISSANILISLGLEPWLNDLIENSGNKNYTLIKCSDLGEWNIPTGAIKYVENIEKELSLILPNLNTTIHKNSRKYIKLINTTSNNIKNQIINDNYFNKNVISMQWHEDFLEWFGFNVIYSYGPPDSISAQDIVNISLAASNNEVSTIVDNLQSGTDFGARISSESGSIHVIFTNFPGAIPNTESYLDMITYNIQKLTNGISTYEFKQGEIFKLENKIIDIEIQRNALFVGVIILGFISILMIIIYKKNK